jgi:hypothetical protein
LVARHTGAMPLDAAQLSSISTALDELTTRIVSLADGYQESPREDIAADLYEVERNLQAATRRLKALLAKL